MFIRESKNIISGGRDYIVYKYKYNAFDDHDYEGPRLKRGTKTSDYFWADSNSTIDYSRIYNDSVIIDSHVIGDLIVGSMLTEYVSMNEGNIIIDSSISNVSLCESYIMQSSIDNIRTSVLISYDSSMHGDPTDDDKEGKVDSAYYSCIKNFRGSTKDICGINIAGIGTLTKYKALDGSNMISCVFDCDDDGECGNWGLFRAASGKSKEDYSFIKGYLNNPELFFRCYTEEQLKNSFDKYRDVIMHILMIWEVLG